MSTFLVIAAVMAAIAAAAVALPLLRDRQSRLLGALLGVLVIGASAGLSPLWSNWNWHAPAQSEAAAGPDVAAMVVQLEKRLQDQPNDLKGWLMLGRSYLTLNRLTMPSWPLIMHISWIRRMPMAPWGWARP